MFHETLGKRRLDGAVTLLSAAAVLACAMGADAQPLRPSDRPQFHADTNLILVPVTVTDGRGAAINGLSTSGAT